MFHSLFDNQLGIRFAFQLSGFCWFVQVFIRIFNKRKHELLWVWPGLPDCNNFSFAF